MGHSYLDGFHESDGSLCGVTDFPFDEVDRNLGNPIPERPTPTEAKALVKIARWIHKDGMNDDDGVMLRALIFCWNVIPELRDQNLTEFSLSYGKKKQSFGRWVDQWKLDFPGARTPHMR